MKAQRQRDAQERGLCDKRGRDWSEAGIWKRGMKVIAGAGNSLSECTDAQSLGGPRRRRKPVWGV